MSYLKAAPYLVIVGLVLCLLWVRGDKLKADNEADKWRGTADKLATVAKTNSETIHYEQGNRATNDRVVAALADDVKAIKLRGSQTRETIREIYRNDKAARDWSSVPIPDGVRNALNRSAEGDGTGLGTP